MFFARFVPALVASIALAACTQVPPRIVDVEPTLVKLRHAATVQVKLEPPTAEVQLSVLPGGPFVRNRMTLPHRPAGFALAAGLVWLPGPGDDELQAYQADENGGFQLHARLPLQQAGTLLRAHGSRLYSASASQLVSIAVNESGQGRVIGHLALDAPLRDFAVDDQHACLLQSDRLLLARIDERGQVAEIVARQTLEQPASSVHLADDACLLTHPRQGVSLFTMGADGRLHLTGRYAGPGAQDLAGEQALAVANGATGLTLLAHDARGRLHWLGSYNRLGRVHRVALSGSRVLTADQNGVLSLFDIGNPATPLLLSDFRLRQPLRELAYADGMAIALTAGQLLRIDFSAEGSPPISSLGVNLGGSRRAVLKDDRLYVADWFSGLHIYDVATPNAPRLLANFHTPGSPKGVLVRDGIAYVADDDHGLQVVDVSDTRHPRLLANLPLDGLAYTMKLRGDRLYLAAHRGGIHIIDVTDPRTPRLLGSYDTPGKSWALALKGDYALVADDNAGLLVFDIHDPKHPRPVGGFDPGGHAEDILIDGDIAYVAFFDQGLHVLDISDPPHPRALAHLPTPGNARGLDRVGKHLYLAAWDAGIQIIDIARPEQPRIIGHYDTRGSSWGVNAREPYLYVLDWWGGVRVLDVRDPRKPAEVGRYQDMGRIKHIALQGRFAYTASGTRGLQVFDITNALNPVWAAGVDFDGHAHDVAIAGRHAFVAAGDGGLVVVDIGQPFQPRWLAQVRQSHPAHRILLHRQYAIVASLDGRLTVYDISEAAQPLVVADYSLPLRDLWLDGEHLWLATQQGIRAYSVKNPSHIRPLDEIATHAPVTLVRAYGDEIFALEGERLLRRYRWHEGRLHAEASLRLGSAVSDIQRIGQRLYLSAPDYALLLVDIRDGRLRLSAEYPSSHRISALAYNAQGLFFAGETTIASALRLPRFQTRRIAGGIALQVPAGLPMGSYHLLLRDADGRQSLRHNAFKVGFPKRSKSRFTLEDLKRKLQQEQFEGKAP